MTRPLADTARAALEAVVGPRRLLLAADDLREYGRDWTRLHEPAPCAVALPGTSQEVAALVRVCAEHQLAVVPSGGRTGLAGGAVAAAGELVLSLQRLRNIAEPVGDTVRVGAGVVNQMLQEYLAPYGLQWPIDIGAKGSCHIGGNLATNAGGLRVLRYGHARNWVLDLEAVTADGVLRHLGRPLAKDNAGWDLKQLLLGSEGIFGIITAATLRLAPLPPEQALLLLALPRLQAAPLVLTMVRAHASACELISQPCLEAVCAHHGLPRPVETPAAWYLLVELEGSDPTVVYQQLQDKQLVTDGVLATSTAQLAGLWRYREGITEALQEHPGLYKSDLSVPVADVARFAEAIEALVAQQFGDLNLYLFGHVGDGNLHVNLTGVARERRDAVDQALYQLLGRFGGSISAEHGIGLLKRDALSWSRNPEEIALLGRLKHALDPAGLLNPGKVLPG